MGNTTTNKETMFNRIFGKKNKKEEEPPPDMEEVSGRMDSRMSSLQGKVKACDQELLGLKQQIKRSRGAARQRLMMRAKNVMRKKKMLDQQYGVMLNQSFNMEQVSFTLANAKDTVESVKAMKAATTELKRAFKEDINLDEIEVENIAQKFTPCTMHSSCAHLYTTLRYFCEFSWFSFLNHLFC